MTAPHSHADAAKAEMAHDGPAGVDSRGLPFIDDLAWAPQHALPAPDRDAPNGDAQRRCGWCGASDMVAALRVALFDTTEGGPLARCKNLRECDERYFARANAERAQEAAEEQARRNAALAAAAVAGAARAREEPAADVPAPEPEEPAAAPVAKKAATPRKRPVRPSKAHEAVLDEAQAKTAEAVPEDAPEGGAA